MPQYKHQDKNTGKEVEIIRSFDNYEDTPTIEEAEREGLTKEEAENAEWVKIITGGAGHVGFGMKGYWLMFLIPFLFSCGTHTHYQHRTKTKTVLPCTVRDIEHDAVVTCPDGTAVLVKAKVIKTKQDAYDAWLLDCLKCSLGAHKKSYCKSDFPRIKWNKKKTKQCGV